MKVLLIQAVALCSLSAAHAKDPEMERAKKEAKEIADGQMVSLRKQLLGKEDLIFSDRDLLPDTDKGKEFDGEADTNFRLGELESFLEGTKKRETLDGDEDFLVQGHTIIQNPLEAGDIVSLETAVTPEEENIQICHESGTYQVALMQMLSVDVKPEIKKSIKHCKGHEHSKDFFWKNDANEWKEKKEKELSHSPSIASYTTKRLDGGLRYTVIERYTHTDDTPSCTKYTREEVVVQQRSETDTWDTDFPEKLAEIESRPTCKLLYAKPLQGAETRMINGLAVVRDSWSRQLFFSCEPSSGSRCAQLRAQGGILKSKKCVESNSYGECDLWEKVYDLGKRGTLQQTTGVFKTDPLWGLTDEFDSSYDKNGDFGSILSTLAVFSDLENNLEEQGEDVLEHVKVFKGEALKCEKSFLQGNVFDCCKEMDGVAVTVKLARCSAEEKCLAESRSKGKCHFIGSQKAKLGAVSEHVYCCFPTKLARIVHEQGRKQLNLEWGKADKPKCHGLSLEELQKIDFSLIDFTEIVEEIKVDKQTYERKLQESLGSLRAKVQTDVEKKRGELSNKPPERPIQDAEVEHEAI